MCVFSGNGTRTYDRTDMSRLLYLLSYAAIKMENHHYGFAIGE